MSLLHFRIVHTKPHSGYLDCRRETIARTNALDRKGELSQFAGMYVTSAYYVTIVFIIV